MKHRYSIGFGVAALIFEATAGANALVGGAGSPFVTNTLLAGICSALMAIYLRMDEE